MHKTNEAVVKSRFIAGKHLSQLTIVGIVVTWFGCSRTSTLPLAVEEESRTGVVNVYVVNYPLEYFAERIGGPHVRVAFPAPSGEDPAFWTPDAETIAAYQHADLILLNGASYAKWTKTVSLPRTKTVDTSASASNQYIEVEGSVTHAHGPGSEHAHPGTAFTTWLDPTIAMAQARAIRQALVRMRPQHKAAFDANCEALESDLKELDTQLTHIVEGKTDRPVFFSHPVYQYLQQRYKLNGKSVHWEPDVVPSSKTWEEFSEIRTQHPAKWMIWEGKPTAENMRKLTDIGVQSVTFAPCGNVPEESDYLTVMRQNVEALKRVFAD